MPLSVSEILERVESVNGSSSFGYIDGRSLLHAYIACLSFADLCSAIAITVSADSRIRLALRSRLLRLLREECTDAQLAILISLVERTIEISDANKAIRKVTDALYSAVFGFLPLPTRQMILDRWVDRGTSGGMARWLKATKENPESFDPLVARAYWRASKDYRAAKSLAYQASPEILRSIIPEIVKECAEGWIISKAIIRAGGADDASWEHIHAEHPATYLFLCARTARDVTDDEAFELVTRSPGGFALTGDRGLAIWAVGQLGKLAVLDRVRNENIMCRQRDVDDSHET